MIKETDNGFALFGNVPRRRMSVVVAHGSGSCLVEGDVRYVEHHIQHQDYMTVRSFGSRVEEKVPISGPLSITIDVGLVDAKVFVSENKPDDPVAEFLPGHFMVGLEMLRPGATLPAISAEEDRMQIDVKFTTEHLTIYRSREEAAAAVMEHLLSEKE